MAVRFLLPLFLWTTLALQAFAQDCTAIWQNGLLTVVMPSSTEAVLDAFEPRTDLTWDQCANAEAGLKTDPIIAPDARSLDLVFRKDPNTSSERLLGVKAENFQCIALLSDGEQLQESRLERARTLTRFNAALSQQANLPVIVHCERKAPLQRRLSQSLMSFFTDEDSTTYYVQQRGVISILTTTKSLQLFFPEEAPPPVSIAQAEALQGRLDSLQMSLFPQPPSSDPRPLAEQVNTRNKGQSDSLKIQAEFVADVDEYARTTSHRLDSLMDQVEMLGGQVSTIQDSLRYTQKKLLQVEADVQTSLQGVKAKQDTFQKTLIALDSLSVPETKATADEANQKADKVISTLKTILIGGIGVLVGVLAAVLIPKATP